MWIFNIVTVRVGVLCHHVLIITWLGLGNTYRWKVVTNFLPLCSIITMSNCLFCSWWTRFTIHKMAVILSACSVVRKYLKACYLSLMALLLPPLIFLRTLPLVWQRWLVSHCEVTWGEMLAAPVFRAYQPIHSHRNLVPNGEIKHVICN